MAKVWPWRCTKQVYSSFEIATDTLVVNSGYLVLHLDFLQVILNCMHTKALVTKNPPFANYLDFFGIGFEISRWKFEDYFNKYKRLMLFSASILNHLQGFRWIKITIERNKRYIFSIDIDMVTANITQEKWSQYGQKKKWGIYPECILLDFRFQNL